MKTCKDCEWSRGGNDKWTFCAILECDGIIQKANDCVHYEENKLDDFGSVKPEVLYWSVTVTSAGVELNEHVQGQVFVDLCGYKQFTVFDCKDTALMFYNVMSEMHDCVK